MHTFGSLSLTTLLGRWKHEATAKIYIDGAAAEWARWQVGPEARDLLHRAAKIFTKANSSEQL